MQKIDQLAQERAQATMDKIAATHALKEKATAKPEKGKKDKK